MKRDLKIKLTFTELSPEGDEVTELVTDASFESGDTCRLSYRETAENGMGDCTVRIIWRADAPRVIRVVRCGESESTMTFDPDHAATSEYRVSGLCFDLCMRTLESRNSFDGSAEGNIYVDYRVEVGGDVVGHRRMSVCVIV